MLLRRSNYLGGCGLVEDRVKKICDLLEESMYILYDMEAWDGKLPTLLDEASKDIDKAHKNIREYLRGKI